MLPPNRFGIEDGPDWTTAVYRFSRACQRRVEKITRIVDDARCVEETSVGVVLDAVIAVRGELPLSLIVEAAPSLVHENEVLPVFDVQAGRARERKDGATWLPCEMHVAILTANEAWLRDRGAELATLVEGTPERSAYRHRSQLTAGVLEREWLAGHAAVLLGQARIEHAAEIHVARRATSGDDDALARADMQRRPLVCGRDSKHPPRGEVLAHQVCHTMLQEDLHAQLPRSDLERPDEPDARGGSCLALRGDRSARLILRPCHRRRMVLARSRVSGRARAAVVRGAVDEDHPMGHEPFERRRALIGEGADDLTVVVTVVREAVGLDDRPVSQIGKEQVRRIDDPVLLLHAGAAAQSDVAPADCRMAADVPVCLDHEHGCAAFSRRNGRREPCSPRADDYYVCFLIPAHARVYVSVRFRRRHPLPPGRAITGP